jgi:hypothetical protein
MEHVHAPMLMKPLVQVVVIGLFITGELWSGMARYFLCIIVITYTIDIHDVWHVTSAVALQHYAVHIYRPGWDV